MYHSKAVTTRIGIDESKIHSLNFERYYFLFYPYKPLKITSDTGDGAFPDTSVSMHTVASEYDCDHLRNEISLLFRFACLWFVGGWTLIYRCNSHLNSMPFKVPAYTLCYSKHYFSKLFTSSIILKAEANATFLLNIVSIILGFV